MLKTLSVWIETLSDSNANIGELINKLTTMKREFKFIDKDKNLVRIKCEIREGKHGDVFTMSGEYCGSMGQCLDSVHPKNKEQTSIIEIWRRYHLNDMHAGTPKQEECLISSGINFHDYVNKGRKSVYDYECEVLERYGLLYDGEYKYGSGWIHQELPEDFECTLNDLIDKIEDIEENENERQVTEDDIDLFDSFGEPEKALVLAIMNELCVNEIDQIDEASDNLWLYRASTTFSGQMTKWTKNWIVSLVIT